MVRGDDTFRPALLVVTAGMVLPALPVALARRAIVSSVGYTTFLLTVGLGFGLASLALVEAWSLDGPTFLFVVVGWPWIVLLAMAFGMLLLNQGEQVPQGPVADVVRTLTGSPLIWDEPTGDGAAYAYPAAFVFGGAGAVVVPALVRRMTGRETVFSE